MKKLLLLLSILSIIYTASAQSATMNPFAYDLKSTYDEVNQKLTFEFNLNANAERIVVVATDHNGTEYVIEDHGPVARTDNHPYYCEALLGDKIPMGRDFTWRVDVYGEERTQATFVNKDNKLWWPTSIDIDNNPENANFGTVFVVEGAKNGITQDNSYLSSSVNNNGQGGVGLYTLNADGTKRPLPYDSKSQLGVDVTRYWWNGGKTYLQDEIKLGSSQAFHLYRVRVSDDGRIFLTAMTPTGEVLYEAQKNAFRPETKSDWDNRNWHRVMSIYDNNGNRTTLNVDNNKNVCNNSTFVAGPNLGFDVRGSGENLKLLMLSGGEGAITNSTSSLFRCDEYDLGTATRWEAAPSRCRFTGDKTGVVNYQGVQVQYDKNGNIWQCQHRASNTASSLVRWDGNNDNGTIAYGEFANWSDVSKDYTSNLQQYRRCGAIRFNEDFTKVAIASNVASQGGGFTFYDVDAGGNIITQDENGTVKPLYDCGTKVNISANEAGFVIKDFAWDYANNLYVASEDGHCIAIYAMPRENNMVSTPAASKYAFSTRYHVKWDNLFVHEQDVEDGVYNYMSDRDELYDYTELNHRLWKLVQVGFNNYRNSLHSTNKKTEVKDQWPTNRTPGTHKIDLRVKDFFINNDNVTEEEVIGFFTNDTKFSWLGDYLSEVSGQVLDTKLEYVNSLDDFINRKGNFIEKGKPEYWRPLFVKHVLGLDSRVLFDEGMPINWQWTNQDELYFVELWVEAWHAIKHDAEWLADNGYQYAALPSEWYYFNTIRNLKSEDSETGGMGYTWLSDYLHILAWRDGGIEGNIVHNVNRDNMELHATYVAKNIDEDDLNPSRPLDFDASNDDVMRLMLNKNFGADGEHTFTISRRLQAGMYNTICLPFDLDLKTLPTAKPEDSHPLSGAIAMEFTGMENGTTETGESLTVLQFTEVTQLQAGVPYLIDVQEDIANDMEFWQVPKAKMILPSDTTSVTQGNITFHGAINPTEIPAQSLIVVANNRLAITSTEGEMLGMRGYFTIDPIAVDIQEQAADGRVMLSFKRPISTSVVVVPESEHNTAPIVRKVMHNNSIYILRNEEVYTIMGTKVREQK